MVTTLGVAAMLGAAASLASGTTTVTLNATVVEVQCTAQQRLRIRACANAVETYSTEFAKRITARSAAGRDGAHETSYEVRQDPARAVLIKTILY